MHMRPKGTETISAFNMHFSPPSLSLLSLQEVSMATLQPGPLQPVWHSQCQMFWPMMHCPFPLHSPGQPSAKEEREINCVINLNLGWFSLVPIGNVTRHLKLITIMTTCMPQTTKKTCQTNSWWTSIINQPKQNHYGFWLTATFWLVNSALTSVVCIESSAIIVWKQWCENSGGEGELYSLALKQAS